MKRRMRWNSTITVLAFLTCVPALMAQTICSSQQSQHDIDARIDALIAKMSIAERAAQLNDQAPPIPRLGLPGYNWWNEGLHGLARDGYATVFPQAVGLAATWDPNLMQQVGDTVSTEARAKFNGHGKKDTPRYGGLTVWSPNINIFRDPRWGRGQETYGEDPFLTASLGTRFVEGVQGNDPFYLKADSTPKHFVAHSGPEKGRDGFNAVVSAHDLADTYQPAFHALLTAGNASSIMCSYNAINGTPSCANPMLQYTVRDTWGFKGYVVSDCDAVGNLHTFQHFTKDAAHSAAASLHAGVDLDCGDTYKALEQAYQDKLVDEASINRALHRLLLARVHLGMMDAASCTPYGNINSSVLDSPEHRALARIAAQESMVLLKNDGTLPLQASTKLALVGPNADLMKVLEANYHGTAQHPITPLDGLRTVFPQLHYAQGSLLADGVSIPISRTALRISAEAHAKNGLLAEYYNTPSFEGKPVATGIVSKVDLDWDRVAPSASITSQQYAVRWTGYVVPPAAGDYTLRADLERCWDCKTHDTFRLYVNDKLVVDSHGEKNDPDHAVVHFADTTPQAIRLEAIHSGKDEGVALEWIPPADALIREAVEAAKNSDVILAVVGLSPDLEGEALQVSLDGFDGGDRTSLALPATQVKLLRELQKLHKPMILALASGSAVALDPTQFGASAMLQIWYPGEEGGNALADIVTGRTNPSGRLPITLYHSANDLPAFDNYSMEGRTYRYFDKPVLFPFGYGLSYSTFHYGQIHLSTLKVQAGETVTADITVRNTGNRAGQDVAELYLQPPANPNSPHIALRGFQRVSLKAGEVKTLHFALSPEQMSFVDGDGKRAVREGLYQVFIGSAQPDKHTEGTQLQIVGEHALSY